jgi:hypothetical protein
VRKILNSIKINNNFSGKLAIFCSDERFIKSNLSFVKNSLQIKRSDLIVIPGGPAFIANKEPNLLERLRILIEAHNINQTILIIHSDCRYYKIKYANLSEEQILEKQVDDAKASIQYLKKLFRNISVNAFHSQIDNSKTIKYTQILLE